MATARSEERDAAAVAAVAAAAIGGVLALAALAVYGSRTAMSVGLGALIAVANLVTLRAIIRAIIQPPEGAEAEAEANAEAEAEAEAGAEAGAEADAEAKAGADADGAKSGAQRDHAAEGRRGGAAWGVFALLKILVLFGGIWFLLTRGLVDPIPLVVGYGVLPLGIAAASLFTSLAPARSRGDRR